MDAFGVVVIVVSVSAAIVAALSYVGANRLYQQIGRAGDLWVDEDGDEEKTRREIIREEVREALEGRPADARLRHQQNA
jgi:hypothetical protein